MGWTPLLRHLRAKLVDEATNRKERVHHENYADWSRLAKSVFEVCSGHVI